MSEEQKVSGVELAIFSGKLNAICEEMGFVLQRCAFSPNIKDRLDFSCAVFDARGKILSQAAHIPVHLGSMAFAMSSLVNSFQWFEGDVVVVNDPFQGGTHLPDVTLVSPVFVDDALAGFVVNRAHHANIGSSSPGSMPLSSDIAEEGVLIVPQKLFDGGVLNQSLASSLRGIVTSCSSDLPEDFAAQLSANNVGKRRLVDWLSAKKEPLRIFQELSDALNEYGSELMRRFVENLPDNTFSEFTDYLEDDGFGSGAIELKLSLVRKRDVVCFDFTGTSAQVKGNLNCPESVSAASVYYVIACLLPEYTPKCDGVFRHIELKVPKGSILNARPGAAVAAGNVETSMRLVDLVQGAFIGLGVDMPAASQGTMNNIAMGSAGGVDSARWDYYETIAGGMGAHSCGPGLSGVQCHMTNTLNTPIESLELHYPLRIERYELRDSSGGMGQNVGGNGLLRHYSFLSRANVTLLTERRSVKPWGVKGSEGLCGANWHNNFSIAGKCALEVAAGDTITIETPGGGGWSS